MNSGIDILASGNARIVWTYVLYPHTKAAKTIIRRGRYLNRSSCNGRRVRGCQTARVLLDGSTYPRYVPTSQLRKETESDCVLNAEEAN